MLTQTRNSFSLASSMVVSVAILSLTTAAKATAQATLSGCYVPNSGTVYRIKAAGLPDACHSKNHVEFTWSLQGPPGPAGPTGPQGSTGPAGGLAAAGRTLAVAVGTNLAPGETGQVNATCPVGKVATGGGFFAPFHHVISAGPDAADPRTWSVVSTNTQTVPIGGTFATAICVPAQ